MPSTLTTSHAINKECKRGKILSQKQLDEYDRVQRLIEEIQCDLVNGVLRSEIFRKVQERVYENLGEKTVGKRQIENYIQAARMLLKEDRVDKINELKDMLYSQYMAQYAEATEMGNVMAAKSILDSIAKTFLPDEKTLNLNARGDITIDFKLTDES
jgi:nitrogenase subunit NifH